MAASTISFVPKPPSLSSHQTALCIAPPAHLCMEIDRLRAQHDKAFGTWPPHINLLYPFVAPESLPQAAERIRAKLVALNSQPGTATERLCLDQPGFFVHRQSRTVFLTENVANDGHSYLQRLWRAIADCFQNPEEEFHPHLSIGQCQGSDEAAFNYLLGKAALLPSVDWLVEELVVLVRDHTGEGGSHSSVMRIWGTIDLTGSSVHQVPRPMALHKESHVDDTDSPDEQGHGTNATDDASPGTTYQFHGNEGSWKLYQTSSRIVREEPLPSTLSISSYNVLVGAVYPPEPERYPVLIRNILDESALADLLVLQEVSDPFLSFLLRDGEVRRHYPFTSHAPPDQPDIGPLTSMRNLVVLSRHGFKWEWLPFQRRHKGSIILTLEGIGKTEGSTFLPVVVVAVHLSCGLTDGAVAAKQSQLQTIVGHLRQRYSSNPWLVAGDFNLTTSALTIDVALKARLISQKTQVALSGIELMLSDVKLVDAWYAARVTTGVVGIGHQREQEVASTYEGEEGATFNPLTNPLAAETVSGGLHDRPQRYDRVLVREAGFFKVARLSQFGFLKDQSEDLDVSEPRYGSDHWGIRALFLVQSKDSDCKDDVFPDQAPMTLERQKAPLSFSSIPVLKSLLADQGMFPTNEDSIKHEEALGLLRNILQRDPNREALTDPRPRSNVTVLVVPVGSYALGVWTASSDLDCLCIGNISTRTFFALAYQKLRAAAAQGVRIVRRVVAASGKMLELEVRGVRVELHYCAATRIAEDWPGVLRLPPSDPAFDLSVQSLTKLQPLRDLDQLQRTIPDLPSFRLAYRLIKLWAMRRGIYSSRFGYLGGIHITLLLARVCKLLYRETGTVTAADLVRTFFHHYATFDWTNEIVYDPFFHAKKPWYYRSAREPMVILTLHRPLINVARAASAPSVKTVVSELERADRILSADTEASWSDLVGDGQIAPLQEFLTSYTTFVKIEIQAWGPSKAKRAMLLGWLESRCALLLVDLGRKLPDLHARIWPARFKPPSAGTTESEESNVTEEAPMEYQGCYLIGLQKSADRPVPAVDPKAAESALYTSMQGFAEQIRGHEKYYDPQTMWIDVGLAKRAEVVKLELDESAWAGPAFAEGEDDDSEEEEMDDDDAATLPNAESDLPVDGAGPATRKATLPPRASSQPRAPKLRPAADVLHRLRWDPALDAAGYVVGWEDRFVGVRETPLALWKAETTDDEFVPLHRVVFFRRTSDGAKVWDRETRVDALFGSGVGGASLEWKR